MTVTTENPVRRGRPPGVPAAEVTAAPEVTADLAAALIRVVQAVSHNIAILIGRNDGVPNATLVRLGAAREDVEVLRAFLNSRPRPAHLPAPEE